MGEFNKFRFGAPQFVMCMEDENCMQEGMTMEFPTSTDAANVINEVLKKNPDAYTGFRVRYKNTGYFRLSFGGTSLDGQPLSDPSGWGAKTVKQQLADIANLYYEGQRKM